MGNSNAIGRFLIFLIVPFIGLINAINNFKTQHKFVIAFFGFFGYMLIYTQAMDAYRYELSLKRYYQLDFLEILKIEDDLYFKIIVYLVSRVTDNPQWMFLIFAMIYGWVFVLIIRTVRLQLPENINKQLYYWIFAVVYLIPFSSIVGVRFPTAFFIMAYAWVLLATQKTWSWKPLLIGFIATLVHWSFAFPLVFLIFSFFNKNNLKIIYGLFLATLVFRFVPFIDIYSLIDVFGAQAEDKFNVYTSENVIETRLNTYAETKGYVVQRSEFLLLFINLSLMIQFYYIYKKLMSEQVERMFGITLVAYSLLNVVFNNPFGKERFIQMTLFLGLISTLFLVAELSHKKTKNILLIASVFPMALIVWVNTRLNFETMDVFLIIGNPIVALFLDSKTSLLSFLGLG
jgi:hypothetical protein